MSNWPPFIDAGTGAITPTGSAINLLSVFKLTMAPMVCAYAQTREDIRTGGDLTRSLMVMAQDGVSDNAGAFRRTWGTP
jgi:hypothetical protein